jgi:eukaryotic-like serine/threonine-protein kinase
LNFSVWTNWLARLNALAREAKKKWINRMANVRAATGHEIEGWKIENRLGEGADGIVYACSKDGQNAAIKLYLPDALEKNGWEQGRERLEMQLSIRGEKHHSNLVQIFEGGESAEFATLYLVMEFVPGKPLADLIGTLPRTAIAPLLAQLVAAAKDLEVQGLVHRDIKPANIVVNEDTGHLTLLDLGVISKLPAAEDARLSGDEFVATLRYSPPEFVWRQEVQSDEAWRAITFYQIGATLHDLIMRKRLFQGKDKPPAVLYDSVRYSSPEISMTECEQWLVTLAKCCLTKDWRKRLQLVTWDSFEPQVDADDDFTSQKLEIRLRQIRHGEEKIAQLAQSAMPTPHTHTQEFWQLQSGLFLEVRQLLMDTSIFPRCKSLQNTISERSYHFSFLFERDENLLFYNVIAASITLSLSDEFEGAVEMTIEITSDEVTKLVEGKWVEPLSVEKASRLVEGAFLTAVNKITSTP